MFGFRRSRVRPSDTADPAVVQGEVVSGGRRGGPGELDGRKVVTRFVGVVARVPKYVRLGWLLMNDPTVSGRGKAALGGGLAYAISPIDPVPGFIPVIGQLDDLAILVLAVRTALKSCPSEVADRRLDEVGLSWAILERDIVTIRATTIWLARKGGALASRAGKALLGMAARRLKAALPSGAAGVVEP
ncbi:MAG: YkvA family protein [Chloroflexota bacterium]